MKWIYLSPHFDDAVYSCGGLIWEQVAQGLDVEVWTICAGLPPAGELSEFALELHQRWGLAANEVVDRRQEEDKAAMQVLGVRRSLFSVPDAIYRRHPKTTAPLYPSWPDVIGGLHPGDKAVLRQLITNLAGGLPEGDCTLVAPLTLGNHADHLLVRTAAEGLHKRIGYYPDYPYTRDHRDKINHLAPPRSLRQAYPVSAEGISAWQEAAAAYTSQVSSFWENEAHLRQEILDHARSFNGVTLWQGWRG